MFPALVRYDEAERGMIEHACRLVVAKSLKAYIYPATHYASSITNGNYPAMGQRLRLKSGFVVPSGWTKEEKAVLAGLKKYGAMVADNGNYFSISVTPDDRWPPRCFNDLTSISATNFEVIQTTGPNEGPRSPGAPVANAGPDQTVPVGRAGDLAGRGDVQQHAAGDSVETIFRAGHGDVWQRGADEHDGDVQCAGRLHVGIERRRRCACRGL